MCSPIDLKSPGSRGSDTLPPVHQERIRFPREATSGSGRETFFPHDSNCDDDDDLSSDDTESREGYQKKIENTVEQEVNCRVKKRLRGYDALQKKMEKQLEQKDKEIETLREKVASKDEANKRTVSELDKQLEEKRKQAVSIRCLEMKLTEADEEIRKLQKEQKITEERCQALIRKHRSEIENIQSSKACTASFLDKERADNRDKDEKLREFELQLSVSQETCSQNRRELQKLKDELSLEKASNTRLTQTTKDLQSRNEELERDLQTKISALEGIVSASLELTNKVKDVKDQQANDDEESDGRAVDSGMYCIDEDDIDSLPPLTMEVLADYVEEIAPKWDLVGHSLSVGTSVIQSLRNQPYSPESKCTQVLEKWLEEDPEFSWTKLFDVLKRQRLNSLTLRMFQRLKPKPQ